MLFRVFGIGRLAENVGKSQENCENNVSGIMTVFGRFLGNEVHVLTMSQVFLAFLFFLHYFHHVFGLIYYHFLFFFQCLP